MPVIERIVEFHDEMTAWRRHLHAHPETAFEERATAWFVADRLEKFGIEVHRGLAKTGVVGSLRCGDGPAIGLRADMDALPMAEANDFPHRSTVANTMHACGHDGHTVMLLGAARYLAETRRFRGTVRFIFQPAEENEAGGRVMVEEGLFEAFPVQAVYGMHNWPGLPVGRFAIRPGPMMAAYDVFEIVLTGKGAHAAMPHLGTDSVVAAAAVVTALQNVTSRQIDPLDAAVISVTQIRAGDTWNVIPERAILRGTTRALRPETQDILESSIRRIAENVAVAHGCSADVRYQRRYPPTINDASETERAVAAAHLVVGEGNVLRDLPPTMAAEDFAFMLREKPGCYVSIGNGSAEGGCILHSPKYDFNDAILPIGASYWAKLAESILA